MNVETTDTFAYGLATRTRSRLDGVPIYVSTRCPEGAMLYRRFGRERFVVMHPRTRITLMTPDLIRRLELLLAWNLQHALIPFDSKHFGLAMAA